METDKILSLAYRDLLKFLRDRGRIVATFVFPIIFLGVFAVTLDAGLGRGRLGFNFIDYVFSGILVQNVFQSSFLGVISLILDREKDFAMSIFVAPVSRYSIILGKILGESLVSFAQLVGIIAFGKIMGVSFHYSILISVLPIAFLASVVGASFGILMSSRFERGESAQRLFPFLVFPMIFSSGAFTPVNNLPPILNFIKNINPLYYGVDLMRNFIYAGSPVLPHVTSNPWYYDLAVFTTLGIIFFFAGTYLFAQKEGNR